MNNAYNYLKQYPFTLIAFILYCYCWCSLFTDFFPFKPVVIGEWAVAPVISLPFSILMLLNCAFRKGHRLFYFITTAMIYLPFLVLSLLAYPEK
jgi:hypothetical protein